MSEHDEAERLRRRLRELEGTAKPDAPQKAKGGCGVALAWLLGAVVGVPLALFLLSSILTAIFPPTANETAKREEQQAIYSAEDIVKNAMRDPKSATFGDSFARRHDGIIAVCGSVSGQNGFGGMTGQRRFIVLGSVPIFEDGEPAFSELWSRNCVL